MKNGGTDGICYSTEPQAEEWAQSIGEDYESPIVNRGEYARMQKLPERVDEKKYFWLYNFCRMRADETGSKFWQERAQNFRTMLFEANLKMIYSFKSRLPYDEHLSVSASALLRSVDAFDYRKGYVFYTLAYTAIRRALRDAEKGDCITGDYDLEIPVEYEIHLEDSTVLDSLPQEDKELLHLRFGYDGTFRTYQELADLMGKSRQAVQQKIERTLRKLRHENLSV